MRPAIRQAKIKDANVTTAKIADANVTIAKITLCKRAFFTMPLYLHFRYYSQGFLYLKPTRWRKLNFFSNCDTQENGMNEKRNKKKIMKTTNSLRELRTTYIFLPLSHKQGFIFETRLSKKEKLTSMLKENVWTILVQSDTCCIYNGVSQPQNRCWQPCSSKPHVP